MRLLDRVRIWAAPILALVVFGLAIAFAVKTGFISRSKLVANRSWLSLVSSIVSAAAILIAAALAYFKFFRGRTFAIRANLTVDVTVLGAPDGGSLHTIVVQADNVGTAPIWNPEVQIEVTELDTLGHTRSYLLRASYRLAGVSRSDRSLIDVLDSGEIADFVIQTMIGRKVWAVTYLVTLRSSAGDAWSTIRAVEGPGAPRQQPRGFHRLIERKSAQIPRS